MDNATRDKLADYYLTRAADEFKRAERTRRVFAQQSFAHGVTVTEIARLLHVSKPEARRIIGGA